MLSLAAFSLSTFAAEIPPQERREKKQDTVKRHPVKSKMPKKKKAPKDTTWRDTLKRKPIDTNKTL